MLKHSLFLGLALTFQAGWSATVSGKVTAETGGAALAQATVIIRGLGGGGGLSGDTATTDAMGNYTFADVDSGRHVMTASKTGYQQATANVNVNAPSVTHNFVLATAGSGGRTGTVTGTVTNARTDQPIANATVRVGGFGGGQGGDSTKTDAQGKYTLDSVAAQGAILTASATGYTQGFGAAQIGASGMDTVNFELQPTGSSLRDALAAKGMAWKTEGKRVLLRRDAALQPMRLRAQLANGQVVAESLMPAGAHEASLDLGAATGAIYLSVDGQLMGALR